ncbi:MAG: hypothetical protein AAGC60_03705 [Acidobacteriota bacterium]
MKPFARRRRALALDAAVCIFVSSATLLAAPSAASSPPVRDHAAPSTPDGPAVLGAAVAGSAVPSAAVEVADPHPVEERLDLTRARLAAYQAHGQALPDWARPLPTSAVPTLGAPPQAPVRNLQTGEGFETLDAAVAAASAGDTLRIHADMLDQSQIVLDKDLVLEGATGSEVLRAAEDTGTSGDDRAWFLVAPGVEVHVRDLVFDGSGRLIYQAFRQRGSGSFARVEFRAIEFEPAGPSFAGFAVVAFGDGPVDVLDSSFSDIGRVGVLYFGTGVAGSLAAGNRYVGKGDGPFLDYALEANGGAVVAWWNNTATDCRGLVPLDSSQAAGLLVTTFSGAGTTALVHENDLTDNAIGLAVGFGDSDTATVEAAFNRLVGNVVSGLRNESTVALDGERNWWGCNGGPGAPGCDAIDGDGTVDAEPWLVLTAQALGEPLCFGEVTRLVADLTRDSTGASTAFDGRVPAGIPATFTQGVLGTVAPLATSFDAGWATTGYTAGGVPGLETIDVTVDAETLPLTFEIGNTVFCDGFESGDLSAWS